MKTSTITIRPLTEADQKGWYNNWQAYLAFYNTTLNDEVTHATWTKILDPATAIYGFAAFEGDNLIGIMHVVLHPNTWNITDCCYLEDLYVDHVCRGMGVGRQLIEYVYQFAQEQKCNRVYWVTGEDNKVARQLYDKLAHLTDMVQYRKDLAQ
ncbi:GNAT family N-acetyltransferase [Psychrobacter sp.]|uniref:GNAT family N-acetyltransferase n=1 Tax=Psychrobacter sp. TaxID=56811 RepID=UPI0025EBDB28|nr:GNAT family N-acetyltransferase [Psychrobacter sp.]